MGNLSTCGATSLEEQLVIAANNNNLEEVRQILSFGTVDVNLRVNGMNALYTACVNDRPQIVSFLCRYGGIKVNESSKISSVGGDGETFHSPLFGACLMGNINCVSVLLEHAKIEVNKGSLIEKDGKSISTETPLYVASRKGNTRLVKLLLMNDDVDPNLLHPEEGSAIRAAVNYGKYEVFQILIRDNRVRLDADENMFPDKPILTELCKKEAIPIEYVRYCLKKSNLDLRGAKSAGPLSSAIKWARSDILKELLKHPEIEVNSKLMDGRTPLLFACEMLIERKEHIRVLRRLLYFEKTDINANDRFHGSPIFVAAKMDKLFIIKELFAVRKKRKDVIVDVDYRFPKGNVQAADVATNPKIKSLIVKYKEFLNQIK